MALVAGFLATLCMVAGAFALALRPPLLDDHHDLIVYALERRGIGYQQIILGEMWPDQVNRQYGAQAGPISIPVQVVLTNGTATPGWLTCAAFERNCRLTITALGLQSVQLPAMQSAAQPAWLAWLERLVASG
jgi:hypothetical protein